MNFDNLILYDLMTGLYMIIPFLSILFFWLWLYSLHCIIQCVKKNPITWNSEWVKSEVKRENRDLIKTKNAIKRSSELKKWERVNKSRRDDDRGYKTA